MGKLDANTCEKNSLRPFTANLSAVVLDRALKLYGLSFLDNVRQLCIYVSTHVVALGEILRLPQRASCVAINKKCLTKLSLNRA